MALAFVGLTACQAHVGVAVDARGDGSGLVRATVTLDKEAADAVRQRVPDLATQLRKSDLVASGWHIAGPTAGRDGAQIITASKAFANPGQAAAVVNQLSGPTGPFQSFRITRKPSFTSVRTRLSGVVDLRSGLAGFGDPTLRQQLGGSEIGVDPAQVQQQLGVALDQVFSFEVAAHLPGKDAAWTPKLGQRLELVATSNQLRVRNLALAGVCAAATLALAVLLLRRLIHELARK